MPDFIQINLFQNIKFQNESLSKIEAVEKRNKIIRIYNLKWGHPIITWE